MKAIMFAVVAALVCGPAMAQTPRTTQYEYDALGRLKTVTTNTGAVVNYTYDPADNRTSVIAVGSNASATKVVVVPLIGFLVIPLPN